MSESETCAECGHRWPCPTFQAWGSEQPAHGPAETKPDDYEAE